MTRPSARYQPPGCDCGTCTRNRERDGLVLLGVCDRLPKMIPHEAHCVEKLWGAFEYAAWGRPGGVSLRDSPSIREHCTCGAYDE